MEKAKTKTILQLRQNEDMNYLKIKIPVTEMSADDLRKIAYLIEELEDGYMKIPFWKKTLLTSWKFFIRYSVSNFVQAVFMLTVFKYLGMGK
ncbi:MAG: hypothetical protein ACRC5M_05185 [Anaeroplasmataceae bacterium]